MTELLSLYPSLFQPAVLAFIGAFFLLCTGLFIARPALFIPVFLVSAPFPKLFSLGYSESDVGLGGYVVSKAPGISLVEIVACAGLCALLLRGGRKAITGKGTGLSSRISLCIASVLLSMAVGGLLNPNFHLSQILYAARHIAVFGLFFLARRYAREDTRRRSPLSSAFDAIRKPGHWFICLGLLYYAFIGSKVGTRNPGFESGAQFRDFMWFFDYVYDFGFYITLVAVLDIAQTMEGRLNRNTIGYSAFWLPVCAAAILFNGERGNIFIFGTALLAFIYFMARDTDNSRRNRAAIENLLLYSGFVVIAFLAVFYILAPKNFLDKLQTSVVAQQTGSVADAGRQVGLPDEITTAVASLPIGDWGVRLILNFGSIQYFLGHWWGVGFGGELYSVGWFAHYELTTVAVEQGVFGLIAYSLLLWRLLMIGLRARKGFALDDHYSFLVMRALVIAFFAAAIIYSLTSIHLQKFSLIFWALLGIYDASLSRGAVRPIAVSATSAPARQVAGAERS